MRPLSVALLSWEYPPVVVGGLSRHVYELARALAADGHDVSVYTRGHPEAPGESKEGPVRVVRVEGYPPRIDFENLVPWVLAFNLALLHRAEADIRDRPPDVLHAHDWLVAYAGAALKDLGDLPMVATIHATEHGRHQGRLGGPVQRYIHEVEWWLTFEAARVITCSAYMRQEVTEIFQLPPAKIEMIPNEVSLRALPRPQPRASSRGGGPLILFAGRLEYEKGVQTILRALPLIERSVPDVGLVVAGTGTYRSELESLTDGLGLRRKVRFEGFLDESRLRDLYLAADLVVVPSLYEPFGLVALETMASGTPVVAADTGGLREIVRHEVTGLRFPPGDPDALARAAVRILTDGALARSLSRKAGTALVARRSWAGVAARTARVYRRAIDEDLHRRAPASLAFDQPL